MLPNETNKLECGKECFKRLAFWSICNFGQFEAVINCWHANRLRVNIRSLISQANAIYLWSVLILIVFIPFEKYILLATIFFFPYLANNEKCLSM